ncbi:MAG TPA: hypothetical protein VJA87_01155 [Candidatus Paceibacterota bacterium]
MTRNLERLYIEYNQLNSSLRQSGIQYDSIEILGKPYILACESGSHSYILTGQILSVELSDTGGTKLFISSRYMGSEPIQSLMLVDDAWHIRTTRAGRFIARLKIVK